MKKRVLLIGYNYAPEPTGIGKYSGEMMAWLAKNGYDCTVVTTYPYYPHWAVQAPYRKRRFWYQKETEQLAPGAVVTVYRCPMYVPAKPTGLKRMLLDFSFSLSAFFRCCGCYWGPGSTTWWPWRRRFSLGYWACCTRKFAAGGWRTTSRICRLKPPATWA